MKKATLFIVGWMLTLAPVRAQVDWGDYSQSFTDEVDNDPSAVGLIVAIRKENNSFWDMREKSAYFDTLKNDPVFRRFRPKEIVARTTFDTAQVHFFLQGAGPQNARLFQFRVTEYPGNRVLVPWRSIDRFTDSTLNREAGIPKTAYLGGYRTSLGKLLIMDVRATGSDQIIATSLIAWESIRPEVRTVYTSETMDEFLQRLQSPWMPDYQSPGHFSAPFTVPSTNANLIFSLQNGTFRKAQIQYELIRNGSV